jgi:tripartite-type tricarboxylate transporter receptor subunit TctC
MLAGGNSMVFARTSRARLSPVALLVAALALASAPAAAQGVADFYRGRTINFVVGFGPGGGYDLYARVISRHIGRHIPGNPIVVVQNMDGAGSVRASNYVYTVAPKDGSVIAAVNQNMPMYQLLGGAGAQFDAEKLVWLGSMANSNGVVYTWHTSGVRTIEDAKTQLVPLGAVGTASDSYIFPTVVNALVGTRFKPIPGYSGTGQINIAIERGEVMGRGGTTWASVQSSNRAWLEGNRINIVLQIGFEKEPELKSVPLLQDVVRNDDDRKVANVVSLPTALGYAHWVAPGVPSERIEALRQAYAATMKDAEFLAEAQKLNMELRPQNGTQVSTLAKRVIDTPKPVLERTAKILGW